MFFERILIMDMEQEPQVQEECQEPSCEEQQQTVCEASCQASQQMPCEESEQASEDIEQD
jgi:hypothetical protein